MSFPQERELESFIAPLARDRGFELESVRVTRAGKKSAVRVIVDATDSDGLEALSRELSAALDAAEEEGRFAFGPGYTLEVSTPGVDAPLTLPRHFRRNRGRKIEAGRLGAVNDDGTRVVLIRGDRVVTAAISELSGAVVEVEFTAPSAEEIALAHMSYNDAVSRLEDDK